jgi:hypothetical protein
MSRQELAYALIFLSLTAAILLVWWMRARSRNAEKATHRVLRIDLTGRRQESGQPSTESGASR